MQRILWCLKQLLPLSYWTVTTQQGMYADPLMPKPKTLVLWRMWLGRCYDVTRIKLS